MQVDYFVHHAQTVHTWQGRGILVCFVQLRWPSVLLASATNYARNARAVTTWQKTEHCAWCAYSIIAWHVHPHNVWPAQLIFTRLGWDVCHAVWILPIATVAIILSVWLASMGIFLMEICAALVRLWVRIACFAIVLWIVNWGMGNFNLKSWLFCILLWVLFLL